MNLLLKCLRCPQDYNNLIGGSIADPMWLLAAVKIEILIITIYQRSHIVEIFSLKLDLLGLLLAQIRGRMGCAKYAPHLTNLVTSRRYQARTTTSGLLTEFLSTESLDLTTPMSM